MHVDTGEIIRITDKEAAERDAIYTQLSDKNGRLVALTEKETEFMEQFAPGQRAAELLLNRYQRRAAAAQARRAK